MIKVKTENGKHDDCNAFVVLSTFNLSSFPFHLSAFPFQLFLFHLFKIIYYFMESGGNFFIFFSIF